MEKPVSVRELLKGIDLVWWPEILLTCNDRTPKDYAFKANLRSLAAAVAEETSLS
jgi:hypothetical protein